MVNIERYKTFLAVCDTMSFVKAGEQLYITQAAVSKSIKALEAELGGLLFIRSNKGIELTPEGSALYDKVKAAINMLSDAENIFNNYVGLSTGEVRIGISTVLTKILLLDVIKKFNAEYPNIKITITNGLTSDLLGMVSKNQLDFVIYNNDSIIPQNATKQLLTKLHYVFVYKKDRFPIEDIKDIEKYPLIVQKKGSFTREFLETYLKEKDINISPSIEVVSQELAKELVKEGIGVGFIYDKLDDTLDRIQCDYDDFVYITSSKVGMTTAANKFAEYIKKYI